MSKKGQKHINIGDLVKFDHAHNTGLVLESKIAPAFHPEEKVYDVKVLWSTGEIFWCLDFTLKEVNYL